MPLFRHIAPRLLPGLRRSGLMRTICAVLVLSGVPTAGYPVQDERARIAAVTKPATDFSRPERFERRPGGAATTFRKPGPKAFSQPSANMSFERQLDFRVGDGIFRKLWVSSPSSTRSSDGLGPLFNARSCQRCHIQDGRGRLPGPGERAESLILGLSVPPAAADPASAHRGSSGPEPVYGDQLQNFAVRGVPAEGELTVAWHDVPVTLADGEVVTLRRPVYGVSGLRYGPMHPDTVISPRLAPPVIGMGLLEAVPEDHVLVLADPDDRDGDGISGRASMVWSDEHDRLMLGRFGWRAGQPTVLQQSAKAFLRDIGISTPLYPVPQGDCTPAQEACRASAVAEPSDDEAEAGATQFDLVVFYVRNLAVPARRRIGDPQVLEGKRLFYAANCIGCHTPKFVTRRDSIGKEQSFQLIWPYSDLLLHDMGEGLADQGPAGSAGREWRTPPLWGIGLTELVSGHTRFLHDGRAASLLEAVLWHGGEAEAARRHVIEMTREERDALLAFLGSL